MYNLVLLNYVLPDERYFPLKLFSSQDIPYIYKEREKERESDYI